MYIGDVLITYQTHAETLFIHIISQFQINEWSLKCWTVHFAVRLVVFSSLTIRYEIPHSPRSGHRVWYAVSCCVQDTKQEGQL